MSKSMFTGQEISDDNPYSAVASGVGFSNPYAVDALGPLERQEQYVAEHLQAFSEKVESEEGLTLDDLEMTARSFIDGLWLNKSEEIGSTLAATAVKFFNPDLAEGKTISQIASEMKVGLEAESARFSEESPWLSGIANVSGSLLSPASLVGGKVISEAARLRKGAQAGFVADDIAATLGGSFAARGADSTRLAQQLGQQQSGRLAQAVSNIPAPVAASVLAGAEGGIIGFEGQDLGDKATSAATTAGISAAVPFAFALTKKGYDFFTEPKMAQQLGGGADFINLMFTDHGLSQWYRSVVSKAYGARTLSEQQARKMAGRALTPAAASKAAAEIKADAARKTKVAKEAINRNTSESIEEIGLRLNDEIAKTKALAKEAKGAQKVEYDSKIAELEEAKTSVGLAKTIAVREADEAVSAANAAFRGQALREAAPPGASVDEINALGAMDPQQANKALDQLWKKYGFKVAEGKTYSLSSDDAVSFIESIADDYADLALIGAERGGIIRDITRYVSEEIARKAPDGVIKGEDLLNLRSTIGRAINGLSDANISTRRFSSEVQDYFNNLLESGLSKSEKAAFDADKYAWGVRSTVDDAIAKASGGGSQVRAGAFDAATYLDALRGFSPRFSARGQGRLQQEAQTVSALSQRNKENILSLADSETRRVRAEVIKEKSQLTASLQKQKDAITKKMNDEINKLERQKTSLKAGDENRGRIQEKIQELKSRYNVQLADIDGNMIRARNETEALKNMMPASFKGSVFENLFNTALVGQAALFAVPTASESIKATLASGVIGSRLLSTELAQRILARQTSGQASIRAAASKVSEKAQALGVTTAQTTGGTAGLVGQGIVPQGVMFSEDRKQLLRNLPISGKAALYRNLEAKGQLDRLEAEDPKLFKELKKAANSGRQ
jgi:hypothetical protein